MFASTHQPKQYHEIRCRAILAKSSAAQEVTPFPFDSDRTPEFYNLDKFVEKYEHLETGEALKDVEVRLKGRVSTKRASGRCVNTEYQGFVTIPLIIAIAVSTSTI